MSLPEGLPAPGKPKTVHVETYGCQMNVSDSEVVASILQKGGYEMTPDPQAADVLLINTCAIRDKAEARIWARLQRLRHEKRVRGSGPLVGLLGCMAERLKTKLLEEQRLVDLVAGPDAYRDLPHLLGAIHQGARNAINVQLSLEETYADVMPVREAGAHSAFVSIMRGCNNMCSFCIVPYTRGRERSRPSDSILDEVKRLRDQGVRQVTLLGQNVNSYADFSAAPAPLAGDHSRQPSVADAASWQLLEEASERQHDASAAQARSSVDGGEGADASTSTGCAERDIRSRGARSSAFDVYAEGFRSAYKPVRAGAMPFAELLHRVASIDPEMRIRFTSPHPKDFGDDCLAVIAEHHNICKLLHMPAQSGSTAVLERMRRGYTRDAYLALAEKAEATVPGVAFSSDIIVGFCGESEADHGETLDLLRRMRYPLAFLFAYSRRDKTHAARHLEDDVPPEVKKRRLAEAMAVYHEGRLQRRQHLVGTLQLVLVEGRYDRDPSMLFGRTDTFNKVCFPGGSLEAGCHQMSPGTYVSLKIASADQGRLVGCEATPTTLSAFVAMHGSCNPVGVAQQSFVAGLVT